MARATEVYSSKEPRLFVQAETTAMTANVTTMYEIPITGLPSISENTFRDDEVKNGAGRTAKIVDGVTITKGQEKEISFQMYMVDTLYMNFLQNGAGKAAEVDGKVLITYNHAPASVGNGGTFSNWTGTMTVAYVPPFATAAQVIPGSVVKSLKKSASKGSEGGRFLVDVVVSTQEEILTDQASPTATVAYTKSDKVIYDYCDTAQINSVDVQLEAHELTYEFNPVHAGFVCNGGASSIGKCIPEISVTGSNTILVDSNTPDAHKLARTDTEIPISLSDGSDFHLTIAAAQVTGDVQPSDNNGYQVFVIPFKAKAGTTGNMVEEKVA